MNTTRKQVAEQAGVSESTVSRALTDSPLIPKNTKKTILKVAKELGYQPNISASRLASQKSFMLGFVAPDFDHGTGAFEIAYYTSILNGCVHQSKKLGYGVSLLTIQSGNKGIGEIKKNYTQKLVDGYFLLGLDADSKLPNQLVKNKIPFVLAGFDSINKKMTTLNFSFRSAIQDMLNLAEKSDYKNMIYITGDLKFHDAVVHKDSLEKEIQNSNLSLSKIINGNYSRKSGYSIGAEIMDSADKDTIAFFANDKMAAGFYKYTIENQIKIPNDIGVVGSDDEYFTRILNPDLCSIRQPRSALGAELTKQLLNLINGFESQKSNSLDCTFILRNSLRSTK